MFLIKDSESIHKVTSIGEFLEWMSIFMESWALNPDFGEIHVFAVCEPLHRFQTKRTPDSDSPWSKVPPTIWKLVFFYRIRATHFMNMHKNPILLVLSAYVYSSNRKVMLKQVIHFICRCDMSKPNRRSNPREVFFKDLNFSPRWRVYQADVYAFFILVHSVIHCYFSWRCGVYRQSC